MTVSSERFRNETLVFDDTSNLLKMTIFSLDNLVLWECVDTGIHMKNVIQGRDEHGPGG